MLRNLAWLIAIGLLAYALEYGLGLTELPTRLFVLVIGVPLVILYAIDLVPSRLGGRLKGARSLDSREPDESPSRDAVLDIGTVIYAGVYLNILFRVRPREWDRFLEIFMVLSPVE